MNDLEPLAWYSTPPVTARPFARYFELDPSQNPTIRPGAGALHPSRCPLPLWGEEGLVIVGRWRSNPARGGLDVEDGPA
jgi:hypothetical protein